MDTGHIFFFFSFCFTSVVRSNAACDNITESIDIEETKKQNRLGQKTQKRFVKKKLKSRVYQITNGIKSFDPAYFLFK